MDETLKQIKDFHGHIGPYVILGYKMGKISNIEIGVNPFEKNAKVYTNIQPPHSCIIDGIQLSSGCTLGKNNIKIFTEENLKVIFSNKNGKKLEIALKPEIKNEIDTTITDKNIEKYSMNIWKKNDEELFDIIFNDTNEK